MFWYDEEDYSVGSGASDLPSEDTSYDGHDDDEDDALMMDQTDDHVMADAAGAAGDEDDDDFDDDIVEKMLDCAEPYKDIRTMQLTEEENQWALEIKQALEAQDDGDELKQDLCDMDYAHYALISKDNVRDALQRIRAMHDFKKEHQIDNTVEQGLYMLGELLQQQQGLLLGLDVDSVTLEGLHVMDIGMLDPEVAMGLNPLHNYVDYNWRMFIGGFYYFNRVCQPCLATVRAGNYTMGDFHAWNWKHMNMELQYRFAGEMFALYPIRFSKYLAFNTNSLANMIWSLLKKVYPSALIQVLQLGCQVPTSAIDDLNSPRTLANQWLRPDIDTSYQRMLARSKDLLIWRKRNEEGFRLKKDSD